MTIRRLVTNPFAAPEAVAPPADAGAVVPRAFHQSLPGYAPTPLRSLPAAAEALGVRAVWLKDESERIGTPSFKILGASWATCRVLADWLGVEIAEVADFALLRATLSAAVEQAGRPLQLAAATDGNHGRAVAIMARLLGLSARIFVPADMVAERIAAIESEGAAVEVVDGGYDDAIRRSAEVAGPDVLVVSDTSWEGYTEPPAWVIDGYSTMMAEVHESIAAGEADEPTVIAAQIGVGAFAAAVVRGFARPQGPRLIGVEPTLADCVTVSIERGELTEIPGPQTSIMAGLNCGTPSQIAWPDMQQASTPSPPPPTTMPARRCGCSLVMVWSPVRVGRPVPPGCSLIVTHSVSPATMSSSSSRPKAPLIRRRMRRSCVQAPTTTPPPRVRLRGR